MNWRRRIRWIVLYPALALAGLHFLGTGSPIPLWRIEHLHAPVVVRSLTETHLVLEDGRRLALPLIKELPQENSLFQAAISNGIEVSPTGEVFGLMWLDTNCGNDPYMWRRIRVNLSDLAGTLHPSGIDDSHVNPDMISWIQEHKRIDLSTPSVSHRNLHLTVWDHVKMRSVHQYLELSGESVGVAMPENMD